MPTLPPVQLTNQILIDTNVTFDNINDYFAYIAEKLITDNHLTVVLLSGYGIKNSSFANISSKSDLERFARFEFQLSNNPFFQNLLGDFVENTVFTQDLKSAKDLPNTYARTFGEIDSYTQPHFLKSVKRRFFKHQNIVHMHDKYYYLHKITFYLTTALFHNDINFVKAFTKQIPFNSKGSSTSVLASITHLHKLVDFNKGSLLFNTIINSVLAKQLTLSYDNTLSKKSEEMFALIASLNDELQDKFYHNLLKKLNNKEQFLGTNIIDNSHFPKRLYHLYSEKFKNISTQTAINQLADPNKLLNDISITGHVSVFSKCLIKIPTLQEFYKTLYTKKTFPVGSSFHVYVEHVFDSISLELSMRTDDKTDLNISLHLRGDSSKFEVMENLKEYFNTNIVSFLDKSILYSHKLLTQFNEPHFFHIHHKMEHKNVKDLFVLFIAEYRENIVIEQMSQNNKEILSTNVNKKI